MLNRTVALVVNGVSHILGSIRESVEKLVELPRNIKQTVLLLVDMAFVSAAMWFAVALRFGSFDFQLGAVEGMVGLTTLIASAIIFLRLGLYRAVIRFMGQQAIWAIITAVS